MAGELKPLPGAEMRVKFAFQLLDFGANTADFRGCVVRGPRQARQFLDVALEGVDDALALLFFFSAIGLYGQLGQTLAAPPLRWSCFSISLRSSSARQFARLLDLLQLLQALATFAAVAELIPQAVPFFAH